MSMKDRLEPGLEIESRTTAAALSQAISLRRIADALEAIAAKPAIDPADIERALINGVTEGCFNAARILKG